VSFKGWITRLRFQVDRHRRKHAQAWRTIRDQLDFQPLLARLEDRRVLSVTTGLDDSNVVVITGDGSNDAIEVLQATDSGVNYIEVWANDACQGRWASEDVSEIVFDGGDGDDALTVNYAASGGFFAQLVTFHGGGQAPRTKVGDQLVLVGGPFASVTHTFLNATDGNVAIDGTTRIVYTGLEPITDNLNPADRVFTFTGGTETIELRDANGANMTIDSTLGESVTFPTPTGSLTIHAGTGDDLVRIWSVDRSFGGSLTINGDEGADSVEIRTDITFDPDKNLTVNVDDTVVIFTEVNLITSGTGAVSVMGGSLTMQNNSSLESSTSVIVTADEIYVALVGKTWINAGTGTATLQPLTAGTAIDLGGADRPGTLGLPDAELDGVVAGTLNVGNESSGPITVTANITRPAATIMNLTSGGAIDFATGSLNTAGGDLTLSPGGTGSVGVAKSGVDVSVGTLAFAEGADLSIVLNGTTVDTQHTQLNVVGQVNLTGADLVLSGMYSPRPGDTIVIVNNDGTDPIIGTFRGLPEGSQFFNFFGSGLYATISYTGGTGNDVVLLVESPETLVELTGGALAITDVKGGTSNDTLTLSVVGDNLRIHDPHLTLGGNTGTIQVDRHTVDVPLASITGSVTILTLAGDDTVTVTGPALGLPADLTIDCGDGSDAIQLDTVLTLGAGSTLGAASFTAESIYLNGGSISTARGQTYTGSVTLGTATTLTSGGQVEFAGTVEVGENSLTVTAEDVEIGGNFSGTGSVTIQGASAGDGMQLGGSPADAPGQIELSATEIARLAAGGNLAWLTFGRPDSTGTAAINGFDLSGSRTNLTILAREILDGGGAIAMGSGGLQLIASNGIGSSTDPIETSGLTDLAATTTTGGIFLRNSGSGNVNVTTVGGTSGLTTVAGGDILLANVAGAVTLSQPVTAAGNIEICAAGGDLQIHAPVSAGGNAVRLNASAESILQTAGNVITARDLGARASGNVDLNGATNAVAGTFAAASTTAGVIEFQNGNGFTIGTVAAGHCFPATSGAISQAGAVSLQAVSGDMTVTQNVTAGGGATATLQADMGSVTGMGTVTGTIVSITAPDGIGTSLDSLDIQASTLITDTSGNNGQQFLSEPDGLSSVTLKAGGGNVTLTAGGAVTQAAGDVITAAGLELLGSGPYWLTQSGNDVSTLAAFTTGAIDYRDATSLVVGTVTGLGTAGVTSGGSDVALHAAGLTISQAIVTGAGDLWLDSSAAVTQTAAITGEGLQLTGSGPFTLSDMANDFTTLSADTTGTIEYRDVDELAIGTVDVLGKLVSGIASGGHDVALHTAGLTINEAVATGVGDLRLDSSAAVTQTAEIQGTGLQLTGSGPFILTALGNDFAVLAAETAGTVEYVDSSAVEVGAVAVLGNVVSGVSTTDDDVTICAESILLSQNVSAGSATVRLQARTAGIQQTGGTLTAATLGLRAAGSVQLPGANDVDTLAVTAGLGVAFKDTDGYRLGTVTAAGCFTPDVTGITAGGDVELCLTSGDLLIDSPLSAPGFTVRLSAESGQITQTATGVITAANLGVRAGGSVALDGAINEVADSFAAASTASGPIAFRNANGFTVGSISAGECFVATSGASSLDGDVQLQALSGSITVTEDVTGDDIRLTGDSVALNDHANVAAATSVVVTADNLSVATVETAWISAGTGSVSLQPLSAGVAIDLGGADRAGTLGLTDAELDRVTAGTLNIGNGSSGAITVTADITRPEPTIVNLTSSESIDFATGSLNTRGGDLTLSPGGASSVGVATSGVDVTVGTLIFADGAGLSIVINGTTADTEYSQLNVAGEVNLTGVELLLSGSYSPRPGDAFVIVDNDGNDPVIGTFSGLPEGATISDFPFTGLSATISYQGGTGNDVVISLPAVAETSVTLEGGNLLVMDINGGTSNDTLTLSVVGTNLRISDPRLFLEAGAGTIQVDSRTVEVPLSSITGRVMVQTLAGNDTVIVTGPAVSLPAEFTIDTGDGSDAIQLNTDLTLGGATSLGTASFTAETITLEPGVTIKTATGEMTAAPLPADMPPPVEVRLVPVDQGGSNVNSMGHAFVEVTVGDAGQNYQITIDWANGVVTYPPGASVDNQTTFRGGQTYRFDRYYTSNPDPTNASAPIPITVTVSYDGRVDENGRPFNGIVFKEGDRMLATSVSDVLTVPGTGLFATIKVVKSEIVPVALRHEAGAAPIITQVSSGSQQATSYEPPATQLEFTSFAALRIFFRRVDAAGQEGEDVELPPELLEGGLFAVFQRFPNGRYRIYLREANSDRERMIQEVNVFQGRIVPPDFRDSASERQMGDESPKPSEPRPVDEPKLEDGARGAEKTPVAKPPLPTTENGAAGGMSAQPAASTAAAGGAAGALGWAVGGGVQRWAEQVDRAFHAGQRSLSRTARLARRLRREKPKR